MPRYAQEFAQPKAFPLRAAGVAKRLALDDQQPLEVQKRVGEEGFALERLEFALEFRQGIKGGKFVCVERRECGANGRLKLPKAARNFCGYCPGKVCSRSVNASRSPSKSKPRALSKARLSSRDR